MEKLQGKSYGERVSDPLRISGDGTASRPRWLPSGSDQLSAEGTAGHH